MKGWKETDLASTLSESASMWTSALTTSRGALNLYTRFGAPLDVSAHTM